MVSKEFKQKVKNSFYLTRLLIIDLDKLSDEEILYINKLQKVEFNTSLLSLIQDALYVEKITTKSIIRLLNILKPNPNIHIYNILAYVDSIYVDKNIFDLYIKYYLYNTEEDVFNTHIHLFEIYIKYLSKTEIIDFILKHKGYYKHNLLYNELDIDKDTFNQIKFLMEVIE